MGTLNLSSGTITGLNAGGLPDGCVQAADLASGAGGKLLQAVQVVVTGRISSTVSDGVFEDISGLTVNITPSSTSSKILVFWEVATHTIGGNWSLSGRLMRDSTAICIGDQVGSNRLRTSNHGRSSRDSSDDYQILPFSGVFLDSPSTTSAVTYKYQWTDGHGKTLYLNYATADSDGDGSSTQASSITCVEVGA